jgi:hypothetical protein
MSITVNFTGVCTHINHLGLQELDEEHPRLRAHRVVLVRADNGAYLNDAAIAPHIARLTIDPAMIKSIEGYPYGLMADGAPGVWQLCGVKLQLTGVPKQPFVAHDTYHGRVPTLRATESGLPRIWSEVTALGRANCYFDVDGGTLTAAPLPEAQAIVARLKVKTTARSRPALKVTCFWNQQESLLNLEDGAVIDVSHTGYDHGDSEEDFLLHYKIFESIAKDAWTPRKKRRRSARPGDISIGCSNSQFP